MALVIKRILSTREKKPSVRLVQLRILSPGYYHDLSHRPYFVSKAALTSSKK